MRACVVVVVVPCKKSMQEIIGFISERFSQPRYLFIKEGHETLLASYFDWRKTYVWDDKNFDRCWSDMVRDVQIYKSIMNY